MFFIHQLNSKVIHLLFQLEFYHLVSFGLSKNRKLKNLVKILISERCIINEHIQSTLDHKNLKNQPQIDLQMETISLEARVGTSAVSEIPDTTRVMS